MGEVHVDFFGDAVGRGSGGGGGGRDGGEGGGGAVGRLDHQHRTAKDGSHASGSRRRLGVGGGLGGSRGGGRCVLLDLPHPRHLGHADVRHHPRSHEKLQ